MKELASYFLLLFSSVSAFAQIGKVGINTTAPAAMLHVKDSSAVFTGAASLPESPGSPPVSGTGIRMMWYPDKAAFRAGRVTSTRWDKDNIGSYSIAMGFNTKASGYASMAIGEQTTASGPGSTAMGFNATANGYASTAIGDFTLASGEMSFAAGSLSKSTAHLTTCMGLDIEANCFAGTVVGAYNDNNAAGSASGLHPNNRLFQIGNGYSDEIRNNAMTVLQNGKIGVNTVLPSAMFHVKDSSVVFTGVVTLPSMPGAPPVSGGGTRMMWYPDKAAFRVGRVASTRWDKDNTGLYSIATGFNTKASGFASTAIGEQATASGEGSTAMGINTTASNAAATATGDYTTASGVSSLATGSFSKASGDATTSMGIDNDALCYAGTVVGAYNDVTSVGSTSAIHPNNRLFQIGNGTAPEARHNAMTVLQNGKIGVNTTLPVAMFHVKDSSAVFTGATTLPGTPGAPPVSGGGTRMMWYPDKAAFRAGHVGSSRWDNVNIGSYSIAMGFNTKASGFASTAMGEQPTASGEGSTAMGVITTASNFASTAMGDYTTASGLSALATGSFSKATGDITTSMGIDNDALCYAGTVLGAYNDITAVGSTTAIHPNNRLFQIGNGTAPEARSNALTVLQNGNIGIGITSPGFLLNFPASLGDKISLWGSSGNHYGFGVQSTLLQIHSDAFGSDIAFGYGSSTSFTERMRIKGNGNVGIGVTAPSNLLEVGDRIRIRNGASGTAGIYLNKNNNTTEAGFIGTYSDDNFIGMYGANGAGWNFIMNTTNGNIGIGTAAPTEKLNVVGNGLFTGTVTANCGVLVCSDIRYKTNILPISNALGSLLSLHGIYYNWDFEKFPEHGFTSERQMGFSAQELEQVYPEMVKTDAAGYKTLDYSKLTPVLVEAIKEQQTQIDQLKEQVQLLLNSLVVQGETKQ